MIYKQEVNLAISANTLSINLGILILVIFCLLTACIVFLEKGERKISVFYAKRIDFADRNSAISGVGTNIYTLNLATGVSTFSGNVNINNAPNDADIAMTIQASAGSNKFLLFGRDSSSSAVCNISSAGAATFSSLTTTAGSVNYGGANTYVFGDNSDLYLGTSGNSRIKITSGGNVLVGTTTDAGYKLQVAGLQQLKGGNTLLNFGELDTNNVYFQSLNTAANASKGIVFFGTAEYMRIKSSGVINISNIPTSAVGLSAGDIYSNLGVLTIV